MSQLTLADAELLVKHINGLRRLESGELKPKTEAQKHFIRVCHGEATPNTPYEFAYLRWRIEKPNLVVFIHKLRYLKKFGSNKKKIDAIRGRDPKKRPKVKAEQKNMSRIDEVIKSEKERQKRLEEKRLKDGPKRNFKRKYIEETWGSREAWKADSARNKFNGR